MFAVLCPKCETRLELDETLVGRRARCPTCRGVFRVPEPPADTENDVGDVATPLWLIAVCAIGILIVPVMVGSLLLGPGMTFVVALVTVLAVSLVWKREAVFQFVGALCEQFRTTSRMRADRTAQFDTPESSPDPIPSRNHPATHSELVEIQPARPRKGGARSSTSSRITETTRHPFNSSKVVDIFFFGPDSQLEVDEKTLNSPLVYFVDGKLAEPFDASLIENGLPVSSTHWSAESLPYWPSYRACSPLQRRKYLDWLTSGRSNMHIPMGYVFIYFYGLERRALIDDQDHESILREILRLLPIYCSSNSFRRYASSLIWKIVISRHERELPEDLINEILNTVDCRDERNRGAMLAIHYLRGEPIPANAAYQVAQHDARSPRSVIIRRHEQRFRELFARRYEEQFGRGIVLRASKRNTTFEYHPASETLLTSWFDRPFQKTSIPNVLGISSQFKPLIEIWSTAVEDLRAYDRAHKKSDGAGITAEMYESLPDELRETDHPDFDRWYATMAKHTNDAGWTFVPVSELASIRGIATRKRLTKKQSEDLLRAADAMDLSLEPDARESGQVYGWEELVSVFPREDVGSEDFESYHAASILLRLGMTVAAADGAVDSDELSIITSHLESQFDLSPQESIRLEHLAELLKRSPVDDARLARKLQHLPEKQRTLIGETLVCVAASDEIISPSEVRALKKLYRNLNLEQEQIDLLAAGHVRTADSAGESEDELILDHDRIRRIKAETAEVQNLLRNVMVGDDSLEAESGRTSDYTAVNEGAAHRYDAGTPSVDVASIANQDTATAVAERPETDSNLIELDRRYHQFLKTVVTRPSWSRDELQSVAREARVMASGAIEAINEWSLEKFGDWLIDDSGDPIAIQLSLLQNE